MNARPQAEPQQRELSRLAKRMIADLTRCKEVRRDALQYADTDPIADADDEDAAWLAIKRATEQYIEDCVSEIQAKQWQTEEEALERLCVRHGITVIGSAEAA